MGMVYMDMPGGKKMPGIGLGTWNAIDETELETALDAALECGYRHIDTAFFYENEKIIGRVLNQWISAGKVKRDDLYIVTKLAVSGIHPDRVEMMLKKSLEDLRLKYLDLYLVHFPVGVNYVEGHVVPPSSQMRLEHTDHVELWKKMEEQVDAGRTKAIGLSNFNIRQIERILKCCRIKPACLQIEIHAAMQQKELVDFCHKNGIVVVAYCPLGAPGYNDFLKSVGQKPKELPNMLQNPVVKQIAQKHRKSPGQVMLRFLIQRNIVPIPKSVNPSRIKENIEVFDFNLDAGDMKKLSELDIGESARICDWKFFPALVDHPEFPWKA
ncbi:unnamed protein product [Acanthoscelides obtectus]|uniref:NADP-dependent oxidoreductase domain-containing protein n=3 Tax=Acanthoscelides obtectus TaxID=200917 RepID=A0A9P0JSK9_ACAOB|nr:unnamed protein product [Acanthoscelides obtectus]CAK1625523.1 Alcohol dehydrogenase [NADP(+)] [Acanthoscelides obtectus]